jgi:hypothetical protein
VYPAGTGLPLDVFRYVLNLFRHTGTPPPDVRWITADETRRLAEGTG